MFASVPQLLVSVLQAHFTAARVCTELPANLEAEIAAGRNVIQVNRFGGGGDVITMDTAYMDVDVWAASLDAADTLAAQVASWMRLYLPGHSATVTSGTGTFAACRSQTGMMQRPSGNPDVKRVGGAFTVTVHSA